MEEKIGKVILDTTCYPGKDLYSDGAIEDEMLAISRDFAPEEFNRVISERKSWPILYHFSHIRENILSWIPFTGEEKVLEIGSGCGAVTGALCERAKEVRSMHTDIRIRIILRSLWETFRRSRKTLLRNTTISL